MQEKWDRAIQLIDEGRTNAEVLAALKTEFGSGVSTTKLAGWRAETPRRVAAEAVAAQAARREERVQKIRAKRLLCKEMLTQGMSGYACQQACKKQFGSGVGFGVIQAMKAELAEEGGPTPEGAIVPVDLPPEMIEPEAPSSDLTLTRPPEPNGNIKAIQRWMGRINAEALHLTRDGRLSVLARHEFNLGGIE